MNVADIKNVEAEAGVIASILLKPELVFYSEQLRPNHFTDSNNAWIYYAVNELVKRGVEKMDVYNITNILNMREATKKATESITVKSLGELFDVAKLIARESVEDYQVLVRAVLDCAFRRSAFDKLTACQRLCCDSEESDIEQKIYCTLDDMMMEFSTTNDVPQYKDIVDQMWQEIKDRQGRDGVSGIPFKFPILNAYVTIESGELIIFGAEAKMGKSMMLLNCAADLLKRGLKVLYLDSELNTRLFTCRLISHLTGIEFSRVKSGRYTEDEGKKIEESIAWMKTRDFTHIYIPIFDTQSIYTTIKKVKHQMGIDVLIVDYFKSRGEGDAFASYQDLGRFVDMIKNDVCGSMGIAGIGAAQATSTGKLADSAKIERNASTIIMITDKSREEIEADGEECGNKKLFIKRNRNGPQMMDGEYIDLKFDGNTINYCEAKQHIPMTPY